MVAWAHQRGVKLRLIKPGKPNQNAYIESFDGRLRMSAVTRIGFPVCYTPELRSKTGDGNTTKSDRSKRSAS